MKINMSFKKLSMSFVVAMALLTSMIPFSYASFTTTVGGSDGAVIATPVLELKEAASNNNAINVGASKSPVIEHKFYITNEGSNGKVSDVTQNYRIKVELTGVAAGIDPCELYMCNSNYEIQGSKLNHDVNMIYDDCNMVMNHSVSKKDYFCLKIDTGKVTARKNFKYQVYVEGTQKVT